MSDNHPNAGSSGASFDARIDSLCDEFEAAWKRGDRPQLEDLLAELDESTRAAALQELLQVEFEFRSRQGETFSCAEYQQRFTGYEGAVWKAQDTQLDRTVAIKIPRKGGLDSQQAENFLREARAAAQLKHASIVSVHEIGRKGERVYIVSDYVEGGSLAERLESGVLTSRKAAECARRSLRRWNMPISRA